MEDAVQVEVAPAADTSELDALQCHGVAAPLTDGLDGIERLHGPDGIEVELIGSRITPHPQGALLAAVVETSALRFAEDGVRQLTESVFGLRG
ncbi:hypothetical protein [Nonomuraea sp. KM90]|uniref:hypothetical protein n=1 Tax=Nonomuraea sp. KM90 TaxID=3457428 RepID=UPI003FCDFDF1